MIFGHVPPSHLPVVVLYSSMPCSTIPRERRPLLARKRISQRTPQRTCERTCEQTSQRTNVSTKHQVFWTFFSVIGGGFYFEEFSSLKLLGGLGFAVGVLVVRRATVCNTLSFLLSAACFTRQPTDLTNKQTNKQTEGITITGVVR